jgi:hypothetical protein
MPPRMPDHAQGPVSMVVSHLGGAYYDRQALAQPSASKVRTNLVVSGSRKSDQRPAELAAQIDKRLLRRPAIKL